MAPIFTSRWNWEIKVSASCKSNILMFGQLLGPCTIGKCVEVVLQPLWNKGIGSFSIYSSWSHCHDQKIIHSTSVHLLRFPNHLEEKSLSSTENRIFYGMCLTLVPSGPFWQSPDDWGFLHILGRAVSCRHLGSWVQLIQWFPLGLLHMLCSLLTVLGFLPEPLGSKGTRMSAIICQSVCGRLADRLGVTSSERGSWFFNIFLP